MMQGPDLPNAAMTRWIVYIQLFTFEIQHNPGVMHQVPDGLSHRPPVEGDSDYSGDDVDIEDGIKLVRSIPFESSEMEYEDRRQEKSLCTEGYVAQMRLNQVSGEIKVLEADWKLPKELLYNYRKMYAGEAEEWELEEEAVRWDHRHKVQDKDGESFWDDILAFLHLGKLPETRLESDHIRWKA